MGLGWGRGFLGHPVANSKKGRGFVEIMYECT